MSSTIIDVWDSPARRWPSIAYVETTNRCNALCVSCLNHRCERTRGAMTMDTFRKVVRRLQENNVMIGAMFCFGEPLLDDTLFEKFKHAKEQKILMPHVGLNTNVSKLVPEMYDDILENVPNITLSFFNTGEEFNRLTGNLDWDDCYARAIDFIDYRDMMKPEYEIFIGCNSIDGSSLANVQEAFADYHVKYAVDAELRWGGSVITGVIDRMIMYPDWRCDGFKGALQIKWNGDCEFCAYDIIGSPDGGETKFGNILTDDWDALEAKFREAWRKPSDLCRRCDYFHHCKEILLGGCVKPDPLPNDWFDWQAPFLQDGEQVCT